MTAAAVEPARGRLFRAPQAAQYLGVSVHHLRRLIATGELIAIRSSRGRFVGVYEAECNGYIERRSSAPVQAPRLSADDRIAHLQPKEWSFT